MIIYLHGFASSAQSWKARRLKQWFAPVSVLAPTFGQDPLFAVRFLEKFIGDAVARTSREPVMLIGSSLGGYYGQYLARRFSVGVVLINPALEPMVTLRQYVGQNRLYHTPETFTFTLAQLQALKRFDIVDPCVAPVPTLVLVDQGDDIIDSSVAVKRYAGCGEVRQFDGGDHGFAHLEESLDLIKAFYQRLSLRPTGLD